MSSVQKTAGSTAMSNIVLESASARRSVPQSDYSSEYANPSAVSSVNPSTLAVLCIKCQSAFEGEWVEKDSLDIYAEYITPSNDTISQVTNDHPELVSSASDLSETESSEWGEDPDWVKLIKSDTGEVSLISPQHHSLANLEYSSQSGCILCTILKDVVFTKAKTLDIDRAVVDSLIGVLEVRPSNALSEHKGSMVLSLSYFVDGTVGDRALKFSIELLLVPYQGMVESSPVNESSEVLYTREFPTTSCLQHIQEWLRSCTTEHTKCLKPMSKTILPSRLLQAKAGIDHPHVSLIETAYLNSQTRYIALSHCWGQSPIIRLLAENHQLFKEETPFRSLSKTFRDAVKFTLALGVQYIWIDSLCIIQDSAEDWRFEASLMCSVYSNAYVTLAATSSRDGAGGLFHLENKTLPGKCLVEATWQGYQPGIYMCINENLWDRQILHAPLNERGWVLQESILSPKTIHCAYDQIWWSCSSTTPCCNETFPKGVPAQNTFMTVSDPLADMRLEETGDLIACNISWLAIAKIYTQRQLTFGSDKLIALAGIAEAASEIMGVAKNSYLAGLWRCDLITDLLWRVAGVGSRPIEYRAPSWSWASIDGEVYFHASDVRAKARESAVARLIEADVTPVGDVLGPLSSGHIILQSPLMEIKLSIANVENLNNAFLEKLELQNKIYLAEDGFSEVLDHGAMYSDWPSAGRDVYFACLVSRPALDGQEYISEGIILDREEGDTGLFHRIGWIRIFHLVPFDSMFVQSSLIDLEKDDDLQHMEGYIYRYKII